MKSKKRVWLFNLLLTIALVAPVLVGYCFLPVDTERPESEFPMKIGHWSGRELTVGADVLKNYKPLDNKMTWRRYSSKGDDKDAFVECIIQEATNRENLHDLFMCLVYSKTTPERLSIVSTPGKEDEQAALLKFDKDGRAFYTMFCYQTRAGYAIYPPLSFEERLRMLVLGRKPCRLVEIASPVVPGRQAATLERIREVAAGICGTPL